MDLINSENNARFGFCLRDIAPDIDPFADVLLLIHVLGFLIFLAYQLRLKTVCSNRPGQRLVPLPVLLQTHLNEELGEHRSMIGNVQVVD